MKPWLLNGGPWLLWLACAVPGVARLIGVYEFNPDYSHGYLVPVIAGYAIWRQRAHLAALPPTRPAWPIPLVGLGAILLVLGHWYDTALQPGGMGVEFLMGWGLWISALGLAWVQHGLRRVMAAAFPVCYLLFGIPMPESWTGVVTLPMRRIVTIVSTQVLEGLGFAVEAAGNVIYFGPFTLGIADACSGMRSLWSLVAACVAIGYLIECRRRHLLALVLWAIPLSFAQNVLRVVCTALAMRYIDPRFGEGWRHEFVGWLTFLCAALVAVWMANRWSLRDPAPAPPPPPDVPPRPARRYWTVGLAALLLACGAVAQSVIHRHYFTFRPELADTKAVSLDQLPGETGPFTLLEREELDAKSEVILNPSDYYLANWNDDSGNQLHLMVFRWEPQRLGVYGSTFRPHTPDICYPNAGWRLQSAGSGDLQMTPGSDAVGFRRIFQQGRHRRVVLFVKNTDPGATFSREFPSPVRARMEALMRSWTEADLTLGQQFSVSVAVDLQPGQDPEEGLVVARRFLRYLAPHLEAYGIRFSVD